VGAHPAKNEKKGRATWQSPFYGEESGFPPPPWMEFQKLIIRSRKGKDGECKEDG